MKKFNHGGNVYKIAAEHNLKLADICDFSANINPFGMSPKGIQYMRNSMLNLIHYPDPYQKDLKDFISSKYNLDESSILITNGVVEAIHAICKLEGYNKIITMAPTFSEYEEIGTYYKYPVEIINTKVLNSFKLTTDDLKKHDIDNSIIFLGNPNNPDGQLLEKDAFEYIINHAPNSLIVIDESFTDFIGDKFSYRNEIKHTKNLVILHSFTKFFACPGLRIASTYADESIINQLNKFIPTWSVNQLAQTYLLGALKDTSYIQKLLSFIRIERARIEALYATLKDIEIIQGQGNFILLKWTSLKSIDDLHQFLANKNIFVRNCKPFKNLDENYIRIAIKSHENNIILYQYIKEFLYD